MPQSFSNKLAEKVVGHAITIERLKSGEKARIVAMLRALEKALIADIYRIDPTAVTGAFQRARLDALLRQTKETIRTAYREVAGDHADSLNRLAKIEDGYARAAVDGLVGVNIMTVALSAETLKTLASDALVEGAPSAEWWSRQAGDVLQRFTDQMRDGILRGETTPDLVRRVRGRREANFKDGIMNVAYRNAEALVRSSVQTVANSAREATWAANSDVVKAIQWVATLDSRTTKICIALDGKVWSLPDYKPVGHDKAYPGPTAHWGCRSTQIAVLKSWEELSKDALIATGGRPTTLPNKLDANLEAAAADARKGSLRASMDGQVSDVTTFDQWLFRKNQKSPAYVDGILGPRRAELWRRGKIKASELTSQDNRPLTISELEKLIAKKGA